METIGYINLFERITKAHVKDCFFENDKLVFIINPGDAGRAIGKAGANVKQVSAAIKKPIQIIEFSEDPVAFLKSLLAPVKAKEIVLDNEVLIIRTNDAREKGQVYGREKTNLQRIQQVLSKYYPYTIKVE